MGRTNIHRAEALASRAGSLFEEIALIPHADKLVYLVSGELSQEQLNQISEILRKRKIGSWIQRQNDSDRGYSYCQGDRGVDVPRINISNGMQRLAKSRPLYHAVSHEQDESSLDNELQATDLLYVIVVQGQTGHTKCKLVVESTLGNACSAMLYEALNGYSTVFTAAILKANLENIQDDTFILKAVHDSKTLRDLNNDPKDRVVGFWC